MSSLFYFILVVGILVVVHESGHFLAARSVGIRTDIFSIGFGYRLFGFNKKYGFTFGNLPEEWKGDGLCDYRLCIFPVGGYVKIAGMVDESFDTEFANAEAQPWEFRSKNAFKKAWVISAGVIMNFLLAIIFFGGMTFSEGKSYWETTAINSVSQNSIAAHIGFQSGDVVKTIDGESVTTWQEFVDQLALKKFGASREVVVERNGQKVTLSASGDSLVKSISTEKSFGLAPAQVSVVLAGVETLLPAGKAGLQINDTMLSINGEKIASSFRFTEIVNANKNNKMEFTWKRGNEVFKDSIAPNSDGLIGVMLGDVYTGSVITRYYNIFESLWDGAKETQRSVELFGRSMMQIFKGNISFKQSFGGPILIAQKASQTAEKGIGSFLVFMAMLSSTLAIINILPFPALDGGHLIMIIIEGIIRKEIPVKIKLVFQQIGIVFLLLLMALVFYNDIARVFGF